MNTAIKHNNLGVALLQKGRHEEALLELKQAAELMYSIAQKLKEMVLSGVRPCSPLQFCETHQCSISTSNSLIRSTPLLMSYNTGDPSSSCAVESAIVLMNMALCYHLDSVEANTMPGAVQHALTLYNMAYSLGVQVEDDERAFDLVLTSLNNLGQLHYEMGDFEQSRGYLEDIAAYVAFLDEHESGYLIDEDRHEFMLNAMVLRNPTSCARAA